MPIVTITMFPGCTRTEKRRLIAAITKDLGEIVGTNPDRVYVVFEEIPKASWGMGGRLVSDLAWAKRLKHRR